MYSGCSSLIELRFANIFSHSVGCLFPFLMMNLGAQQFFNFDGVQFIYSFLLLCFWNYI